LTYKWKMEGLHPVSAQDAGEALQGIYERKGKWQAADVVEESRPEAAPLHPCFEWDDPKAAKLWREQQARNLIGCIVTVQETKKQDPVVVRSFVHAADSYHPTEVVMQQQDLQTELIKTAIQDVEAFQKRLEAFYDLQPIRTLSMDVSRTVQQLHDIQSSAPGF